MKPLFYLCVFVVLYMTVGTMDFEIARAVEKDRKERQAQEAPIWSKKCARKGMDVYASQADGGKWSVVCVDAQAKP